MGTLTIGRVGMDLAVDPTEMSISNAPEGTELSVSGELALADVNAAKALKDQIGYLVRADDYFVPFTFSTDPMLDGYYQVLGGDVDVGPFVGYFPFDLELRRIGSAGSVMLESKLTIVERDNDFAAVTPTPFHAVPAAALSWEVGTTTPSRVARTFADGVVYVYHGIPTNDDPVWSINPADFYDDACYFKFKDGAGNLQFAVSKDIPATATNFELGNGGIRVTPNGTASRLDVEFYDGTDWRLKTLQFQRAGSELGAWDHITILRLATGTVTARLYRGKGSGVEGYDTLDITLRRGSRFIECLQATNVSANLDVILNTAEAGTDHAVGVRATVNDANGHRYTFICPKTHTTDNVNGGIGIDAVTKLPFAFGLVVAGDTAVAGDDVDDLTAQYFQYVSELLTTVMR